MYPGRQLRFVDIDDRLGKSLRGFLRKIVSNATRDGSVLVFAREFFGVGAGIRVWGTIGIAFEGDGGNGDYREFGKPLFEVGIFWFAVSQTEPPAVVMDHDADVIRIVKSHGAAL